MFQSPVLPHADRKDHIWHYYRKRALWKCVLCGALAEQPPDYPTDRGWLAENYEALSEDERKLAPEHDKNLAP